MTSARYRFEDFAGGRRPPAPVPDDIERKLVESYEHGYKAGWDDATRVQTNDRAAVGADLARSLQDISFTYHEVREGMMRSVEPLLRDLVAQVLPKAAEATLGQSILDALRPMLETAVNLPVELVVNPANRTLVEDLLTAETSLPLSVVEEDALGSGQAFVRLGAAEKSVDMEEVLGAIGRAVDAAFGSEEPQEIRNAG